MESTKPKVSIGLAVFNGERYLEEAINSVLSQTFSDFELIVSDNASTDETMEICKNYATKDSRVRYFRNEFNIGVTNNENRTLELSKGEYFKLMAHDDIIAPTFLEKCLHIFEKDDSVVVCYPAMVQIDERGQQSEVVIRKLAESEKPVERFKELIETHHDGEATYGLVRTETLSKIQPQPNYPFSDIGYLCELSLQGRFYQLEEPLYYKRFHAERVSGLSLYQRFACHKTQDPFFQLDNPSHVRLILTHLLFFWLQLTHFHRIIHSSPLTLRERKACYLTVLRKLLPRLLLEPTWEIRQKLGLSRSISNRLVKLIRRQPTFFDRQADSK